MGMLNDLVIFIYGRLLMRGVAEEKTSRIVEVILSSVSPFQLMLGKILGIGAVGLTQTLIWIVFSRSLNMTIGVLGAGLLVESSSMPISNAASNADLEQTMGIVQSISEQVGNIPLGNAIARVYFLFYRGLCPICRAVCRLGRSHRRRKR